MPAKAVKGDKRRKLATKGDARRFGLHFFWVSGATERLKTHFLVVHADRRTHARSASAIGCVRLREANLRRLALAVLLAKVAISFHCQRATVGMSQPSGYGRYVDAAFDAACREEMSQIVMR